MSESVEDLKKKGNTAIAEGNFQQAITLYTRAIKLDPTNAILYSNRAAAYSNVLKWEESLKDARDCTRLDPTFMKGYWRAGNALLQLNRLHEAKEMFHAGIDYEVDSTNCPCSDGWAKCCEMMSSKGSTTSSSSTSSKPAASTASSAKSSSPSSSAANSKVESKEDNDHFSDDGDNDGAVNAKSKSKKKKKKKNKDKGGAAEKAAAEKVEKEEKASTPELSKKERAELEKLKDDAREAMTAARYSEAAVMYSRAIFIEPDNAILWSNRSAAYAALSQWEDSLRDARQCIKLDRTFVKGHWRAGNALMQMEMWNQAKAAFDVGIEYETPDSLHGQPCLAGWRTCVTQLHERGQGPAPDSVQPKAWSKTKPSSQQQQQQQQKQEKQTQEKAQPQDKAQATQAKGGKEKEVKKETSSTSSAKASTAAVAASASTSPSKSSSTSTSSSSSSSSSSSKSGSSMSPTTDETDSKEEATSAGDASSSEYTDIVPFESLDDLKEQGRQAMAADRYDDAVRIYTMALKLDAKNAILYSNRSAANAGRRNFAASLSDARQCMQLDPDFVKGHWRAGHALQHMHRWREARDVFQRGTCFESPDSHPCFDAWRAVVARLKETKRQERYPPKAKTRKPCACGQVHSEDDEDDDEEEEQAVSEDDEEPDYSLTEKVNQITSLEVLQELGKVAMNMAKFQDAVIVYSRAIQLQPRNAVMLSNRAAAYAGLKSWRQSLHDARQCVRLDPSFIKGYWRIGNALMKLNRFKSASLSVDTALRFEPNNAACLAIESDSKKELESRKRLGQQDEPDSDDDDSDLKIIHPKYIKLVPNDDLRTLMPVFRRHPRDFVPKVYSADANVYGWGLVALELFKYEVDAQSRIMRQNLYQFSQLKLERPEKQFVRYLADRKVEAIERSNPTWQHLLRCDFLIKIWLSLENNFNMKLNPSVWRRVRVSGGISLRALHDKIIGPLMGWSRNYHAYMFMDPRDGAQFGPNDCCSNDMMHMSTRGYHMIDDTPYKMVDLIRHVGDQIGYNYDLGDYWAHAIEVEKIYDESESTGRVEVLDGGGVCPPEDSVGCPEGAIGIYAFRDFQIMGREKPNSEEFLEYCRKATKAHNFRERQQIRYSPLEPFDVEEARTRVAAAINSHGSDMNGTESHRSGGIMPVQFPPKKDNGPAKDDRAVDLCRECGSPHDLKSCGGCNLVRYCSPTCAKQAWKHHKRECKK